MRRLKSVLMVSALACANAASAGEVSHDWDTAAPIVFEGYEDTVAGYLLAPPIEIWVNRKVENIPGNFITLSPGSAEMNNLIDDVLFAMGLWEMAPGANLNLTFAGLVDIGSIVQKDGKNVVTMTPADMDCTKFMSPDGVLPRVIQEFDINVREIDNEVSMQAKAGVSSDPRYPWEAILTLTHELGHGLGLDHSWLGTLAVKSITDQFSLGSVMSYQSSALALSNGALNPDDIAQIARAYPHATQHASLSSGAIRGRLVDASGASDLFGANVLLIDSAGQAILQRTSGYTASKAKDGVYNGFFELDGVPPGTYDLVAAPFDDPEVKTAQSGFGAYVYGEYAQPVSLSQVTPGGYAKAWVRNITVVAKETVDLGYVVSGVDRSYSAPTLVDARVVAPTPHTYQLYRFYFWSTSPWELAHDSGNLSAPHYSTRLKNQAHLVTMYGWNGASWTVLQPWTNTSFQALERTMMWSQHHFGALEARMYDFFLARTDLPVLVSGSVYGLNSFAYRVHGDRYRTHLPPGDYSVSVQARFGSDDTWTQKMSQALSVP